MAEDKRLLIDYSANSRGTITFWDGKKGHIPAKGTVEIDSFSKLTNVLYVSSLKANMISISQICDKNHNVQFT